MTAEHSLDGTFSTPAAARLDASRKLSATDSARVLRLRSGRYTWGVTDLVDTPSAWPPSWSDAAILPNPVEPDPRTVAAAHTVAAARNLLAATRASEQVEQASGRTPDTAITPFPVGETLLVHTPHEADAEALAAALRAALGNDPAPPAGRPAWLLLVGDLTPTVRHRLAGEITSYLTGHPDPSGGAIADLVLDVLTGSARGANMNPPTTPDTGA